MLPSIPMCFSASASFTAGTLLSGFGVVTLRSARTVRERPFAALPLLFGLQQLIEGVVWLALERDMHGLDVVMTYVYACFSHLLWPVLVPLAVYLIEPVGWHRRVLGMFAAFGVAVSLWMLFLVGTDGVTSCRVGHHIDYEMSRRFATLSMSSYLAAVGLSQLFSTHRTVRAFGLLTLVSFGVAYAAYETWLLSVWCFFAAALSVIVMLHFKARFYNPGRWASTSL
jgi:hypothetical protein